MTTPTSTACSYPNCKCPFDAPADPAWCARGLPRGKPVAQPAAQPVAQPVAQPEDRTIKQLERKLRKREKHIEGMRREIERLQRSLAMHALRVQSIPSDVERAVQNALCNVRMIPVRGAMGSDRIVEVKASKATPEPTHPRTC